MIAVNDVVVIFLRDARLLLYCVYVHHVKRYERVLGDGQGKLLIGLPGGRFEVYCVTLSAPTMYGRVG